MAYTQNPCVCGGTSFHVFPELHWLIPTSKRQLVVTAVVCTQCARMETFGVNAGQIAHEVPDARMISAGKG